MIDFISGLNHWQIDLLATVLLLQGAIFALIPEEIIIMTMGLLWSQEKISFSEAFVFIQLGLLPANLGLVLIGKYLGKHFFLKKRGIQFAQNFFLKFGGRAVFLTRFMPLIRAPMYFVIGISQYPALSFLRFDAWASCFQIPLLLFAGKWIETQSKSITGAYKEIAILFGTGLAFTVMVNILYEYSLKKNKCHSCQFPDLKSS